MLLTEMISALTKDVLEAVPGILNKKKGNKILSALESTFPVQVIKSKKQNELTLAVIEKLMNFVATHPNEAFCAEVRTYLEGLSLMVANYEREAFPNVGKKVYGREMLKYLMELQGLTQTDIQRELGGQPNVSAVLKGTRKLNARQIQALAKRLNVSPSIFFDT